MTFLAGCPGVQDTSTATEEPTATATATDEPTESPVETEPTDASSDPPEDGESVLVDQMGYRPSDEKAAVVRADAESFTVVDTETDAVVTHRELGEPTEDANSGDTVRQADFSDVTEPGNYVLAVNDNTVFSHEFTVDEGVWGRTLADIGRHYTLNRANTAIDDPLTGLSLEPGHPQDAEAKLYFSDEFHEKGDTLDVTGAGENATRKVHDRIIGATDIVLPGHVVGGPNAEGGDPVLNEYIETESPVPAKCYRDVQGSYASNEAAIDYAAPLVFALAHVTPADAISPTE